MFKQFFSGGKDDIEYEPNNLYIAQMCDNKNKTKRC